MKNYMIGALVTLAVFGVLYWVVVDARSDIAEKCESPGVFDVDGTLYACRKVEAIQMQHRPAPRIQ